MPSRFHFGQEEFLSRVTSVSVEQVHDALQILRREPRVDRRRLDVSVPEMLVHRAEIASGALEQFDPARVTEGMRVHRIHADALAERLDDLPDAH